MPRTIYRENAVLPSSRPHIGMAQPERLRCHFQARALYTRNGCRNIQEFTIDVVEISRTHLVLKSRFASFIPDNFTLTLGARQHGMGCAVYSRVGDRLNCNLLRAEPAAMVAFLSTVQRPGETLEEIRHPLFPRSRVQSIKQ